MAKLAILLAAVFGVLLVVASAHRTIITVEEEEKNPGIIGSLRCDRQLRRAGNINRCKVALWKSDDEAVESDVFQQCCRQFRQVEDERCRCKALKDYLDGVQVHPMLKYLLAERAIRLPQVCGMERGCEEIRLSDY